MNETSSDERRAPTPEATDVGASNHKTPAPTRALPDVLVPPGRGRSSKATAVANGIVNVLSVALIIYLTYFFTLFFSTKPLRPTPGAESQNAVASKVAELHAEDHKLLTTYGWSNPATKRARIPIERAMELVATEGLHPAPKPAVPEVGAAVPTGTAVAAAAAPAPSGLSPIQMYNAVCLACHGIDGRGTLVRLAMPQIPDFTDAKWQTSRSDAELQHSITEGKGLLMLPMKDKLALAHTEAKDLVALVRGFQGGKTIEAMGSQSLPPAPLLAALAVSPPAPPPTPASTPAPPAPGLGPPAPAAPPALPSPASAPGPPASAGTAVAAAAPAPSGLSPIQMYNAICLACHGIDGRGTAIRVAMPQLPDFTDAKWQTSRSDAELQHSMVEGKGQFMLPMKDKLALGHTDVKDLLALIRGFRGGKQVIPSGPQFLPPASLLAVLGPSLPVPAAAAPPTPASPLSPGTVGLGLPTSAAPATHPALSLSLPAPTAAPLPTGPSPERVKNLRAAAELFRANCMACHGPDGRGTALRVVMPTIPDFTLRQWHEGRSNPQLAASILDGKGALMPFWRGRISAGQAQDLVAYVRSLGPPDLLAAETSTSAFATQFRQLQQQLAELEKQAEVLLSR
jgi:mono/diheme cytochrome c family protein